MTEVLIFKTKEDGAKYYKGEPCNHLKKTFRTLHEAISFSGDMMRYMEDGESIVITPENKASVILEAEREE